MYRPYLVFDIETIPDQTLPNELAPQFDRSQVKTGNTKQAHLLEDIYNKAEDAFYDGQSKRMSTNPMYCQIVAVSWASTKSEAQAIAAMNAGDEEEAILTTLWSEIAKMVREDGIIVTFNGTTFDLPAIIRRSMLLDITVDRTVLGRLTSNRSNNFLDLMYVLGAKSPFSSKIEAHSLEYYCRRFGIPNPLARFDGTSPDGSMVYPTWAEGRVDDLLRYARNDAYLESLLYERVRPWIANT